VTIKMVGV